MTVDEATLVNALRGSHGLEVHAVDRLAAGVTTRNFTAIDGAFGPVFVEVYPANTNLAEQEQACGPGMRCWVECTAGSPSIRSASPTLVPACRCPV